MDSRSFIIGLIICFLLSFSLGIERQIRRRYIGLRTMILVAIGSYFFVSFSFLVKEYTIDISRIASQVVAGIGFLGAGVILKDSAGNKIRGLTTAATLWCDAGIGILCAGGFIYEAIIATCIVLFANIVLRYINSLINSRVDEKYINEVYEINFSNVNNGAEIVMNLSNILEKFKYIVINTVGVEDDNVKLTIEVRKNKIQNIDDFVSFILNKYNVKTFKISKVSEHRIEDLADEL